MDSGWVCVVSWYCSPKQEQHPPPQSCPRVCPAMKKYIGWPQGSHRAVRHCLSHKLMVPALSTLKVQARPPQQQCPLFLRSLCHPCPPLPSPSPFLSHLTHPPSHCQPPSSSPHLLCPCSRPCP